jgi:prepilin-type N-terminal cleavage/methylation domain-containing protein
MKKVNQKGFSIIEVLIVLAIAGLIMLIVFLAVPALQRNTRNQSRQSDASKLVAAINQCLSNANGKVTACDGSVNGSTAVTMFGWDASDYGQLTTIPTAGTSGQSTTKAVWSFGQKCDGNAMTPGKARDFAVLYQTEGGGSSVITACVGTM